MLLIVSQLHIQGNPGKGGRIDVLKLMQDLSCGESSNTDLTTTTDMPNGLTTIQESDNKILEKPQSPGSSGETSTSQSKSKMHRPLAATKNPRRLSDTSVVKKPTPTKLRPSSVSSSKILPSKSPHSKKHT